MKIESTGLDGLFLIENRKFSDERGAFIKTFHSGAFKEHGLDVDFKESFYSISKKNVLRGMHFQLPPCDHAKLVYVISGEIIDVALDIRKDSSTYGEFYSTVLSADNHRSLYMGKGYAHGFLSKSDDTIVGYLTSTVHSPDHDAGIKWDSFGMEWGCESPIISARDDSFVCFEKS